MMVKYWQETVAQWYNTRLITIPLAPEKNHSHRLRENGNSVFNGLHYKHFMRVNDASREMLQIVTSLEENN
jgi:hypothetical protein